MSEEERKRMAEVAEWLNTDGYQWARDYFHAVSYGNPYMAGGDREAYGLYSLKDPETDVSGSPGDFCAAMWWGNLPGDGELLEAFERGKQVCLLVY